MNVKQKLKLLFKSIFTQFGSAKTESGMVILWDGDELPKVGDSVFTESENEGEIEYVAVEAGEYTLEDGTTLVINADSKIEEIREKEEEQPAEPEQPVEEMAEEEQPVEEQPVEEEPAEPEFDAQAEIANLNSRIDELASKVEELQNQLGELLKVPVEEDAFSAAKKQETVEEKKFICKANKLNK